MGGSLLLPALLVTKSSLRSSGDGSIIIGARDFSPDSRSAGHLLPYEWLFVIPGCFGNEIQPPAGRNPASRVEILTPFGRNLCAAHTNDEAPKPKRFRGFIYPGSYLLSRDLSSDYHRRADVSLPGSEWDRVGPSGYDHQALALFKLPARLSFLRGLFIVQRQADIRVACFLRFLQFTHSVTFDSSRNCLSPGWCIRSVGC